MKVVMVAPFARAPKATTHARVLPLARALARLHPGLVTPLSVCVPFFRTHRLVWALKR